MLAELGYLSLLLATGLALLQGTLPGIGPPGSLDARCWVAQPLAILSNACLGPAGPSPAVLAR